MVEVELDVLVLLILVELVETDVVLFEMEVLLKDELVLESDVEELVELVEVEL